MAGLALSYYRPTSGHASTASRAAGRSQVGSVESSVLELQRLAGNQAVTASLGGGPAVQLAPPAAGAPTADRSRELIDAAVALATDGKTLLLPGDVRDTLEARAADDALAAEFDAALARIDAGGAEEGPIAPLNVAAGDVISALERGFILDRRRSTLDLLGEQRSRRYRKFAWDRADFPDGAAGPHEGRATEMIGAMTSIRPERRPNSTEEAVVSKGEANRAMEATIRAQFVPVEGQPGHKLHREAAAAFVRMREAAAADGVKLHILDADRRFETARKRAKKAKNKKAVGDFSSHSLGLAVDLRMSTRRQHFSEVSAKDFQNIVDMTAAPAHKWMFLHGESFGWFPYQHEPWHWEYNPSGFRDAFRESVGLPPDEDEPEGGAPPVVGEDEGQAREDATD